MKKADFANSAVKSFFLPYINSLKQNKMYKSNFIHKSNKPKAHEDSPYPFYMNSLILQQRIKWKLRCQAAQSGSVLAMSTTVMCLSIGTPKIIHFPFVPNGKFIIFRCPKI